MVRVALELVPTLVDMLGSDTPQGTAAYARDGVFERHATKSGFKAQMDLGTTVPYKINSCTNIYIYIYIYRERERDSII